MTLVRIYCVKCGELNYDDEEVLDYPCPNCDELSDQNSDDSENDSENHISQSVHDTFSLNHKDFDCKECSRTFIIRDDSQLNICFTCKVILCDRCFRDHKNE